MSKLETNTIDNISGSSTLTIGDSNASTISIPKNITLGASGTTITVPSGATITNNGTQTGFGGTNTPAWLVSLTSNQSVSNATATKVNFDSVIFDTNSVYDNITDYDVTIPTGEGGKYWLYSRCWLDAVDGEAEVGTVRVYLNGSLASNPTFLAGVTGSTGDGGKLYMQVSGLINLSAGDVLTVFVYHNSGSSEILRGGNCSFHGYKILT